MAARLSRLTRVLELITKKRAAVGDLTSPVRDITPPPGLTPQARFYFRRRLKTIEKYENEAAALFVELAAATPHGIEVAKKQLGKVSPRRNEDVTNLLAWKAAKNAEIRAALEAAGDTKKLAKLNYSRDMKRRSRAAAKAAAAGQQGDGGVTPSV